MSVRTTVSLLVMVVLMAGAFWFGRQAGWLLRGAPGDAGAAELSGADAPQAVRLVQGDAATSLRIERPGAAPLVFRRTVTGWDQVEPVWYPLKRSLAAELVAAVTAPVGEPLSLEPEAPEADAADDDAPAETDTLASLALDPPSAEVRVTTDAGEQLIRIGEELLATGTGYAWTPDAGAVRVPDTLHRFTLHLDPAALRERRLPVPLPTATQQIELRRPDQPAVTLERLPDNTWWLIASGVGSAADADAVATVLDLLVAPVVNRFMDAAGSDDAAADADAREAQLRNFGLGGNAREVTELRVADTLPTGREAAAPAARVRFGRASDLEGAQIFAQAVSADGRLGPPMQVNRAALAPLLDADADSLRLRRLFRASLGGVRAVELVDAEGRTRTAELGPGRAVPGWLRGPAGVVEAEAASFLPGFRSGDAPVLTVTVRSGISTVESIRILRRGDEAVAIREGEALGLVLPPGVLQVWLALTAAGG